MAGTTESPRPTVHSAQRWLAAKVAEDAKPPEEAGASGCTSEPASEPASEDRAGEEECKVPLVSGDAEEPHNVKLTV